MIITDNNGGTAGTLNSWSLDFTTQGNGLILLSVDRETGVGTPVGTGSTGVFGDITALGFDGGVVHFYDNTFDNFRTANPTTGVISAATASNPAGFNTSAMTYNSRLDELVVHDSDNPDQLLQFNPPGGIGGSVLTIQGAPLDLIALEHSPFNQSYTIDIDLGDHVYGLDFGNEIQPDALEPNESIEDATDLGTVVHTEIEHLSIAGDEATACNPIPIYVGDSDNDPSNGITLQDLLNGGSIIVCDKVFEDFNGYTSIGFTNGVQDPAVTVDPRQVAVQGILPNNNAFNPGPGLDYQSQEFGVDANQSQDTNFEYIVRTLSGVETIVDNSVDLNAFAVGANDASIRIAETVFDSLGNVIAQKLATDEFPMADAILDNGPHSMIRVQKDIGLDGGTSGAGAFLSDFTQNFSQIPGDKRPDWDYFKVTSWATGSFEFWLDQQAGYLAAEVINGAGEVVASVDATEVLFEDDFEPTDSPGWMQSTPNRWTLSTDLRCQPGQQLPLRRGRRAAADLRHGSAGTRWLWSGEYLAKW